MTEYSHRVVLSGRGKLHLEWLRIYPPGYTMCGRRVLANWTRSTAEHWEREKDTQFVCSQCRDPLGPNARIEP